MLIDSKQEIHETVVDGFYILDIFCSYMSYLSIENLILCRRVNKYFNKQLLFKFECINYNIYFNYNNSFIIKCIKNEICNNLFCMAKYYFQSQNSRSYELLFEECEFGSSNISNNNNKFESDKSLYLLTIKVNKIPEWLPEYAGNRLPNEYGNCIMPIFADLKLFINNINTQLSKDLFTDYQAHVCCIVFKIHFIQTTFCFLH